MDQVAAELGLIAENANTGRTYKPRPDEFGIGVYAFSSRGVEFCLKPFRDLGEDEWADDFMNRLEQVSGKKVTAREYPYVPCQCLVDTWETSRSEIMEHYFRARQAHLAD